jgi:hypothetical protein
LPAVYETPYLSGESGGLSITGDTPLSIGQPLDVSIDWPVPLDASTKSRRAWSSEAPEQASHCESGGTSSEQGARG